ncbi:MAG: ATP-binding protein [Pseudomonadota bacterium]|nr:ATP-binding protein [Pseudomonadota bacterium]
MTNDYEKLGAFYLGKVFDPATGRNAGEPLLYDSRDLTTHAVCVGMTGSGKTGLCLALLEEAAIDGIPAICIDPKGDLGNLLLTFPALAPQDFAGWVDAGEAARRDLSIEQYAARVAEQWRGGLAEWDQRPERIGRLRDAVDIAIYTPGADSGLPLSILQSLAPPPAELLADTGALSERIGSVVSGLLALLGRDADPLQSRDHILLSNILGHAWGSGQSLDLAGLVAAVQKPPLQKLGALDLETFFPAKERMELALAINGLLASPRFASWTRGEPLDAQRLLFTPEGKPRIAIICIAHLSDAERMFVVTLLLNEVIGWMRRQSGTASLRAILYMDEIFGYFPPTANPPSKQPMLTLLKQARAYGLGVVLATQNPVDLDYKGLGNTGTWLIGRLQTERDRDRLLDGLSAAMAGSGPSREQLAGLLGALTQRVFLMRNVHDDAPVLMKSRWALSYLRGPLTPAEISRLMAPRKQQGAGAAGASKAVTTGMTIEGAAAVPGATASRPVLPSEVTEAFLPVQGAADGITYRPGVVASAKLHYVDKPAGIDAWHTVSLAAPFDDDGAEVLWSESATLAAPPAREPVPGATFAEPPAAALRAASYARWSKALAAQLYEQQRLTLLACDALKQVSQPGESEGDFRARLQLAAREKRDAEAEKLRQKYAPRLATLQEQKRRALHKVETERSQSSQQKLNTAISVGATILGAFLGRKVVSASSVGRATTAARSASRIGREAADVARAEESAEVIDKRLADLGSELQSAITSLDSTLDASCIALREIVVTPRKSDLAVGNVSLLWTPWRKGADGFPVEVR